MISDKEQVVSMLERLPADASIEDIQYHLYVMEKIRAGVESAEREEVLTQDEVEERMSKWLV